MKKYALLLFLQIKSAFLSIPKMFATSIIFAGLVGLLGFAGTNLLYGNSGPTPMNVALVIPENGKEYSKIAFSFLYEIETVSNYCTFIEMNEEKAFADLKTGNVDAIILLPDNFVEHIMNGTNTPAQIILPKSGLTSSSPLFRELVKSGVSDLSVAQAGIYAIDDLCLKYGLKNELGNIEWRINESYLSYALNRDIYYEKQTLSSTGSMTLVQFYVRTGIVLLLMLSAISCISFLQNDPLVFSNALTRIGISSVYSQFCKSFSISVIYFLPIAIICLYFRIFNLPLLLLGIYCIFVFSQTILCFSDNTLSSVLALFILSLVMMFVSGSIIPSSFLPGAFKTLGAFMPTTYFLRLWQDVLCNTISITNILLCLLICVLCLLIQNVVAKIKSCFN